MIINNVKRAFTAQSVPSQAANAATHSAQPTAVADGFSADRADWQQQVQQNNALINLRQRMMSGQYGLPTVPRAEAAPPSSGPASLWQLQQAKKAQEINALINARQELMAGRRGPSY